MGNPRRILIVEDDAPLAQMCVEMCRSHGYEAEAASNGREAIERMSEGGPPAVVLTDLIMPEMDGLELLRAIKQQGTPTDVVVMTSYGTVDNVSIIRDRDTGQSRGFGFVEMADAEAADRAIAELNGTDLEGRALTVNEARPRADRGGGGGGGRGRRREPRW